MSQVSYIWTIRCTPIFLPNFWGKVCLMVWKIWYIYCEMITKISLVNIHTDTKIKNKKRINNSLFSFVMRTLRIYSVHKFHVHHTAVWAVVVTLCITSLVLTCLEKGGLSLLVIFIQSPLYHPLPLVTTSPISFPMSFFFSFFFSCHTYKWDHRIFVFLCLTYFT